MTKSWGPLQVAFHHPESFAGLSALENLVNPPGMVQRAGQEQLAFPEHLRSQLLPGLAQGILPHRERGIAP